MEEFDLTVKGNRQPQPGTYLISEPFLADGHFDRTVVLLCEHTAAEGSLGYILNKPTNIALDEALDDASLPPIPLFVGGPVAPESLHMIHKRGNQIADSQHVKDEVWWGGDMDQALDQLRAGLAKETDFRFFLGYSGWGPGQLDGEMRQNSWIVSPNVRSREVFYTPAEVLWKLALEDLGGKFKTLARFPADPSLN